jgi:L-ascorbate 6-phosphate lactonase
MWDEIINTTIPAGKMMLWGLGGPSVVLRTARTTLLIDPFLGPGVDKGWERAIPILFSPESIRQADAVFSSHHHLDHCHEPTLRPILDQTSAHLYGARSSAAKWQAWGFPAARCSGLDAGDTITLGDIEVRIHRALDWEDTTALAFSFVHGGRVVYFGGDTLYFDGLAEAAPVNWALLAYARNLPEHPAKLYMDDDDIRRAIEALQAEHALIMHWDLWLDPYIDPAPLVERLGEIGYSARALHQAERLVLD